MEVKTVADLLSGLESNVEKKTILKLKEDFPTQPAEVNIKSKGKALKEHVVFTPLTLFCHMKNCYGNEINKNEVLYRKNLQS